MTITSATWTVGTASAGPVTVTFATGSSLDMGGAGGTSNINIHGNLSVTGGTITLDGAGTTENWNVYGNMAMSGGLITTSGATSHMHYNVFGNYTMTGGTTDADGASGLIVINVNGNGSFSGPCAMTNTGAGCTSAVHFALPTASGSMQIDNTSTGTWSKTNIYVDAGCTAQLAGNFSTTTGAAAFGLMVNGKLICPAAYVVNGTRVFALNSGGTLVVAHATGINGAIVTTGTKTFNTGANYTYNGSAAQVTGTFLPASLISPSVLTISNTAAVTLSQATATTGTLAFTAGVLNTGSFTMTTPGSSTAVTGAGATSYVNGTLVKTISSYSTVFYEVGDVNYAPMGLSLSTAGTAGSLGVKVSNGLHPNVATSGLPATNMANHYWTISNLSAAGPATVTAKATYNTADIIGGSNAAFVTQVYASSAWLGTPLSTTNTATPYTSSPTAGIALASIAGDYIFGNGPCTTAPITGTATVCEGATTTLSSATTGGTWSSAATAIATVSSAGVISGVSTGTAVISYTAGACTVTTVVTVNPLPVAGTITGVTAACIGFTTTLANATTGGTWSSSNTAVATVSAAGVVSGVASGTSAISYTVTNGCGSVSAVATVTVAATLIVAPITGPDSVCPGSTITMANATGGGVWTSQTTSIATIAGTGIVTGVAPGFDTIIYTITNSCGTKAAKKRIKVRTAAACLAGVAIAGGTGNELMVYPNPNKGMFTVKLSSDTDEPIHIVVTDITGVMVRELTSASNKPTEVQLGVATGMYVLTVYSGQGIQVAKVFIE